MPRSRSQQFSSYDEFDDWTPQESTPAAPAPKQKAVRKDARRTLGSFDVPTHDPATGKAHTKKRVKELQRGALQRHEAGQTGAAVGKRKKWEASPDGQERVKEAPALIADAYRSNAARQREMGQHRHADHIENVANYIEKKVSPAQVHHGMLGTRYEGHGVESQQLPGFENPHAVGTPPRWEDLAPDQQQHAMRELKRRAGTDIDTMSRHFGAQLDQAHVRAHQAGHVRSSTGEAVPFTKHFYDEHPSDAPAPLDRPRQLMKDAAKHHDVEFGTMVGAVALTSPNTKFTQGQRGERTSPNVNAAREAVIQHEQGVSPSRMGHIPHPDDPRGIAMSTARPENIRRAGRMLEHVAGGGRMGEARNAPSASSPEGSTMWSAPKVGPFTNSFHPDIPDFFVSDVHSGGGGGVPHLGTDKPFLRDAAGKQIRIKEFHGDPRSDEELVAAHGAHKVFDKDKSQREKAIESPHFHSMMDYAARQALEKRGLGSSVRQAQASQWGEEQIRRKAQSPKLDVPSHEDAYPHPSMVGKQFKQAPAHDAGSHQLDLF